ncbi:helix-turn-helix domain-containing protein [Paraburkholderia hayleyella]|uniref:helix-turn-helix domain-containing protein n=1 Tax=Paraburkholderia hayleyella TaxID=2152889 RepID=UPI0012919497|nr:helix-turn-helix domain-containing protein [Paraburkholderia hayleyella]
MDTFGERVRAKRIEAGLTQADLARDSGISQSTIAQIESGRNQGSKHLLALAEALHVTALWLQNGGRTGGDSKSNKPLPRRSSIAEQIADLAESLTPTQQKELLIRLEAQVAENDRLLEELSARKPRASGHTVTSTAPESLFLKNTPSLITPVPHGKKKKKQMA